MGGSKGPYAGVRRVVGEVRGLGRGVYTPKRKKCTSPIIAERLEFQRYALHMMEPRGEISIAQVLQVEVNKERDWASHFIRRFYEEINRLPALLKVGGQSYACSHIEIILEWYSTFWGLRLPFATGATLMNPLWEFPKPGTNVPPQEVTSPLLVGPSSEVPTQPQYETLERVDIPSPEPLLRCVHPSLYYHELCKHQAPCWTGPNELRHFAYARLATKYWT